MTAMSAQALGIERHLNSQERALVHLLLYRNLQCAADITQMLSRTDVRAGEMTEELYYQLQHKVQALQDGLQVIGRVAGITPDDSAALAPLGQLPSVIRLQAS